MLPPGSLARGAEGALPRNWAGEEPLRLGLEAGELRMLTANLGPSVSRQGRAAVWAPGVEP